MTLNVDAKKIAVSCIFLDIVNNICTLEGHGFVADYLLYDLNYRSKI